MNATTIKFKWTSPALVEYLIEADFIPEEKPSRHCPGCPASVCVQAMWDESGAEVRNFDDIVVEEIDSIREAAFVHIHESKMAAREDILEQRLEEERTRRGRCGPY